MVETKYSVEVMSRTKSALGLTSSNGILVDLHGRRSCLFYHQV